MARGTFEERVSGWSQERRNLLLGELPRLLTQLGRLSDVVEVLCDLEFIKAKCSAGMTQELVADFLFAIRTLAPTSIVFESFQVVKVPAWLTAATSAVLDGSADPVEESGCGRLINLLRQLPDGARVRSLLTPVGIPRKPLPTEILVEDSAAKRLADLRQLPGEQVLHSEQSRNSPSEILHAFASFVQKHAYVFERNPTGIVEAARNWALTGVVTETANKAITSGEAIWVTRDPRPKEPGEQSPCLKILANEFGSLRSLAASRDGAWAITGSTEVVSVWNLREGICHRTHGHSASNRCVVSSDEMSAVAFLDSNNDVFVWNPLAKEDPGLAVHFDQPQSCLGMTADGACVFSAGEGGVLSLLCVKNKNVVRGIETGVGTICSLAISPDGRLAIIGSVEGFAQAWDVRRGKCLRTLSAGANAGALTAIAIARDAPIAFTGYEDGTVRMWDLRTGDYLRRLGNVHRGNVESIATSDDGSVCASADHYRRLCVWDTRDGSLVQVFYDHANALVGTILVQDARFVISAGRDNTVRVWDLAFPKRVSRPTGHTDAVLCISQADYKEVAISCGRDRDVRLWNTRNGTCTRTLSGHQGSVGAVEFLPVPSRAASISSDGTIHIWNLKHEVAEDIIREPEKGLLQCAFWSAKQLAVIMRTNQIPRIWDISRGRSIGELPKHKFVNLFWMEDGTRVLTVDSSCRVFLWSVPEGKLVFEWKADFPKLSKCALSPDGKTIALVDTNHRSRIYETQTGQCLVDFGANRHRISGLCFATEGLVLVDAAPRVSVWSLNSCQCKAVSLLRRQNGAFTALRVHPSGQFAVCAHGGCLSFVDLHGGRLLSEYHCESEITAISTIKVPGNLICGTRLGQLHFLKLRIPVSAVAPEMGAKLRD
jgi:WD40 repeat protein